MIGSLLRQVVLDDVELMTDDARVEDLYCLPASQTKDLWACSPYSRFEPRTSGWFAYCHCVSHRYPLGGLRTAAASRTKQPLGSLPSRAEWSWSPLPLAHPEVSRDRSPLARRKRLEADHGLLLRGLGHAAGGFGSAGGLGRSESAASQRPGATSRRLLNTASAMFEPRSPAQGSSPHAPQHGASTASAGAPDGAARTPDGGVGSLDQ
eukprot:2101345-Prymnesium_polylepis.1